MKPFVLQWFPVWTAPALLTLLCASALSLHGADLESNLRKTFPVKPGGQLIIDADRGSIELTTSERPDIEIEVRRKLTGVSSARAEEIFKAHEVTFDQDGDRVEVRAKLTKEFRQWFNRGDQSLQVQFQVALPKQFNLDLRTAAGSVSSTDIAGTVKARTSGGNLSFNAIQGPFEGTTSAGSIELDSATGPVKVTTSGGNIRLGQVEAETSAVTAAGWIAVELAKGKVRAHTSGGNLVLGELASPAELETSAGSIHVKLAKARLAAKTSGGSITIQEARDTVVAHTSAGSIHATFSAQPQEDCRLTTSGGSIEVKLAEKLAFDVDARTSAGRVSTQLPITTTVIGEQKRDGLVGKLNGGGKALILKTSAGSISIKKL